MEIERHNRCSVPYGPSPEAQAHSAKARGEIQILPQYYPRAIDQELRQISGGLNAKITPLFEKKLSASDVARIGRLVLPKRCAENDKRERVVKASRDITINTKKVIFQVHR
ncbi:B3 domain-containing protein-like protein [Tanacetum coccineum]